jgi:hypothetical protein
VEEPAFWERQNVPLVSNQQAGKVVVETLDNPSNPSVHGRDVMAAQGVVNAAEVTQVL